jgi:hypothetical protein
MSNMRRLKLLPAVAVAVAVLGVAAMYSTAAAPAQATTTPHAVGPALAGRTLHMPAAASTTSYYYFPNYNDSNRCLGINSSGDAGLWNCTFSGDQQWLINGSKTSGSDTYYQFKNQDNKCLGVTANSTSDDARIVGQDCDGTNDSQFWAILNSPCSGEFFPILNYRGAIDSKNDVVGVSGNSSANGAAVVLWSYQGVCNNQFWEVDSTSS